MSELNILKQDNFPFERQLFYVYINSTKETFGPITEETIREWISQKRINAYDSISKFGDEEWILFSNSNFSDQIVQQIRTEQILLSTCTRCGSQLSAVVKDSKLGLWLIIVGVILTPVFLIGTPLWVIGMIMRFAGKKHTYYTCPNCKNNSR
jgi:hypothetical protein